VKRVALVLLLLCCTASWAQTFPFEDTTLVVDFRVEDLLSRLTIEEKLSLMEHRNPAIPSLGLPAYSWWNEALHGVGRNGRATVWPMPIGLAATFDTGLVRTLFSEVALEAREKRLAMADSEAAEDYHGLTFFTPNINLVRDPRWGRGMETYGEDPFLTAQMGLACVQGLQHCYVPQPYRSDDWGPLSAAACLKHLAVHSGPEGQRHQFDARVEGRDLWTTYLPAFEFIVARSDVQQVMCGYNRLNGSPCCTNRELLVDILRHQWGYDGLIVTDCWALNDCWERDSVTPRHETHPSAARAAADAFGSEVDLECGSGLAALHEAVDSGWVSESKVNEHVRRILRTRLRVMMEDDRWVPPRSLSPQRAAMEGLVLLKNNGVLPFGGPETKIFLTGPNAADSLMPLGNYNGTPAHTVSLAEGLGRRFRLVARPREADVVVYAGGLSPRLEGEELEVEEPGFFRGDRTSIELPAAQRRELRRLRRSGRPVVLLLCSGGAVALRGAALRSEAVVACWYAGEAMGDAAAAALAGDADCFGRLPVTFYRSTRQLPPFDDYAMHGRTYRYLNAEPLFPFGHGLNYARLVYDSLRWEAGRLRGVVRNTGPLRPGSHWTGSAPTEAVVEVFARNLDDPDGPQQQLVGVQRVCVPLGEERTFAIQIDPFWLRVFDPASQQMAPPDPDSRIRLSVGGLTVELKAEDLLQAPTTDEPF